MLVDTAPIRAAEPNVKLANTILYLLKRCGPVPPGKMALLKMLWHADYWHYRDHLRVITGVEYVAMKNGPVIENYQGTLDGLVKMGLLGCELKTVYNKPNKKEEYSALVDADESVFSPSELATLGRVISECGGLSGTELSRRTHLEGPWQLAWDEQSPNKPINRVLFRWLDNMPDEECHEIVLAALSRDSVRKEIEALDVEFALAS